MISWSIKFDIDCYSLNEWLHASPLSVVREWRAWKVRNNNLRRRRGHFAGTFQLLLFNVVALPRKASSTLRANTQKPSFPLNINRGHGNGENNFVCELKINFRFSADLRWEIIQLRSAILRRRKCRARSQHWSWGFTGRLTSTPSKPWRPFSSLNCRMSFISESLGIAVEGQI